MVVNRLREILKIKGMTQTELAEKVGITQAFISEVCDCKKLPSLEVAQRIAFHLGYKTEDIFFTTDVAPRDKEAAQEGQGASAKVLNEPEASKTEQTNPGAFQGAKT